MATTSAGDPTRMASVNRLRTRISSVRRVRTPHCVSPLATGRPIASLRMSGDGAVVAGPTAKAVPSG